MIILNTIIFFIFGTIVGSFINVVALRYNTGLSFISGRSKCFSCGKILHPYELIPVFSFLFLGGRCSVCKSKISRQYPLVELLTGILFALAFLKFGASALVLFYFITISLLIAISVYDLNHKIIPDSMVFLFDGIAFIFFLISGPTVLNFWAGPMLFAFFAFFWLVSGGKWMGLGDAKLALGVGWLLGFELGISAIALAFWIGTIVSLAILGLKKLNISKWGLTMKSEIPFAPFIIFALLLEIFTSWNLLTVLRFG